MTSQSQACPNCGTQADALDIHCINCGEKLNSDSAVTGPSPADFSESGDSVPSGDRTATQGSMIVVEVESNRAHVLNHASLLRFRVTNNLASRCVVTLRVVLHGQGRLVEQDAGELEQTCQFERRGDQFLFSFPFLGLLPGEIPVRELQAVARSSDASEAVGYELPDQSLFVKITDRPGTTSAPGIVISGGINLDLSQLKEMYGADIKDLLKLDARREADPGERESQWHAIRLRPVQDLERLSELTHGTASPELPEGKPPTVLYDRADHKAPAVGIDLGTTFSALAYLDEFGRPVTLADLEGEKITPSVILADGTEMVVGTEALRAIGSESDRAAECVKRHIGSRVPLHLGGSPYPPEVLQAWILHKLHRDSQQRLGPYTKAVITVPAYFNEMRRKATQDAGYMAGLEVMDIINEPTAAALAFGCQSGFLRPDGTSPEKQRIVVYDLGGGTFDVTIMEIEGADFVVLGTDGDVVLGGRDWDERIVDYVSEEFSSRFHIDPRDDSNARGRLWRECEAAKRALSARKKVTIRFEFKGEHLRLDFTRETFQRITADLIQRTRDTTELTVLSAGLELREIDRVLLVGGSTRMPAVGEMLRSMFGKEPCRSLSPDEAVAHGAALYAGSLLSRYQGKPPEFHIQNVNSHSLGVVAFRKSRNCRENAILIPRNTPLPATAKRRFGTHQDNQQSLLVRILEGEANDPDACAEVGKLVVRHLPAGLPKGAPVEVRFQYEENGRLSVSVAVASGNEPVTQDFVREHSMTEDQLNHWRKIICGKPPAISRGEAASKRPS